MSFSADDPSRVDLDLGNGPGCLRLLLLLLSLFFVKLVPFMAAAMAIRAGDPDDEEQPILSAVARIRTANSLVLW